MNGHRPLQTIDGGATIPYSDSGNSMKIDAHTPLIYADIAKGRPYDDRTESAGDKTLHPEQTVIEENSRSANRLRPVKDIPKKELCFRSKTKNAVVMENDRRLPIVRTNVHRTIQHQF